MHSGFLHRRLQGLTGAELEQWIIETCLLKDSIGALSKSVCVCARGIHRCPQQECVCVQGIHQYPQESIGALTKSMYVCVQGIQTSLNYRGHLLAAPTISDPLCKYVTRHHLASPGC
eukprot:scaffold179686_cov19-Tisochrysis_lutea.AAC.3